MVTSLPRIVEDRSEPREMVRVQFKENDIRSYTRKEAEAMIGANPGAFIVGESAEDGGQDEDGGQSEESAPSKPAPRRKPRRRSGGCARRAGR